MQIVVGIRGVFLERRRRPRARPGQPVAHPVEREVELRESRRRSVDPAAVDDPPVPPVLGPVVVRLDPRLRCGRRGCPSL
jgi:hypothetical protein